MNKRQIEDVKRGCLIMIIGNVVMIAGVLATYGVHPAMVFCVLGIVFCAIGWKAYDNKLKELD